MKNVYFCLMNFLATALAVSALAGCVEMQPGSMPEDRPLTTATPGNIFPGLDPGAKDQTTLHFQVHAYGSDRLSVISDAVEELYNRIMTDTGLYSFQPPAGLYSIVVYATQSEYAKKTGQPEWSAGLTMGNSIYGFDVPQLPVIVAHEMSHLLWHEYMGSPRMELRWLNEGLAVYEENSKAIAMGLQAGPNWEQRRLLREQPIPFDQMVNLVPATERERRVSLWYQQVGDVVRFMIERGGRNGFSAFLGSIKEGRDMDTALRAGFPGVWTGAPDLEAQWRRSL